MTANIALLSIAEYCEDSCEDDEDEENEEDEEGDDTKKQANKSKPDGRVGNVLFC